MPAARSPEDLQNAVESMFRIRAVESPPDERGLRKIWHRGVRGAELVSDVDASGRVVRHELTLFDDVIAWDKGNGFTTSAVIAPEQREQPTPSTVEPDAGTSQARLERAANALKGYAGQDRFIQHVRDVLLAEFGPASPFIGDQVTQPKGYAVKEITQPPQPPQSPAQPPPMGLGLVMIGMGFLIVVTAIIVLLTR